MLNCSKYFKKFDINLHNSNIFTMFIFETFNVIFRS